MTRKVNTPPVVQPPYGGSLSGSFQQSPNPMSFFDTMEPFIGDYMDGKITDADLDQVLDTLRPASMTRDEFLGYALLRPRAELRRRRDLLLKHDAAQVSVLCSQCGEVLVTQAPDTGRGAGLWCEGCDRVVRP